MKKFRLPIAVVAALSLVNGYADPAETKLEKQFPHPIQFELGSFGFYGGDQITITSLRGNRKHLEAGGNYLVEGSYTLASADSADLAFYSTSRGPSDLTPVQDGQHMRVTRGSGTFHLYKTNSTEGWFHLTFYPDYSRLRSGVYFGEKGRDSTIMRKEGWFPSAAESRAGGGNEALLAYLGNPVPPPADMDSKYDKKNLFQAFTRLCQHSGLVITGLSVDDSEFPYLLYGTLDGEHTLEKSAFEELTGYTYGGSVRGSGDGSTYFAVNMVPLSQLPQGERTACNHRLMLRLEMLADKARHGL